MESTLPKSFGLAIRQQREQLGLTQDQLAGRARLHRIYVSDVERGHHNVTLESIERLSVELDIPISLSLTEAENELESTEKVLRF